MSGKRLSGIWNARRDEQAVDEIPRSETGAHGLESLKIRHKMGAVFRGECPEIFVFNDIEAEVPSFGAVLVQNFAAHDLQAVRHEVLFTCKPRRFVDGVNNTIRKMWTVIDEMRRLLASKGPVKRPKIERDL